MNSDINLYHRYGIKRGEIDSSLRKFYSDNKAKFPVFLLERYGVDLMLDVLMDASGKIFLPVEVSSLSFLTEFIIPLNNFSSSFQQATSSEQDVVPIWLAGQDYELTESVVEKVIIRRLLSFMKLKESVDFRLTIVISDRAAKFAVSKQGKGLLEKVLAVSLSERYQAIRVSFQ